MTRRSARVDQLIAANLLELEVIAAVVIGGTLLTGGRGTIVGTVLGVLIFVTLGNVFTLNNLSSSVQAVARGVIIVLAVLLQMRLAEGGGGGLGRLFRSKSGEGESSSGGPVAGGTPAGAVSGGTSVPGAPGGDRPGTGSAHCPPFATRTCRRPAGEGTPRRDTCLQRGSAPTVA